MCCSTQLSVLAINMLVCSHFFAVARNALRAICKSQAKVVTAKFCVGRTALTIHLSKLVWQLLEEQCIFAKMNIRLEWTRVEGTLKRGETR
jgi:hypothetical protein